MQRFGSALFLVGLWSMPLAADEPLIEFDSQIEVEMQIEIESAVEVAGDHELVADFGSDLDAEHHTFMSFGFESHEAVECPEEHADHECFDGSCIDADCHWMHSRANESGMVGANEELFLFNLSGDSESSLAVQTFGGPLLPSAAINQATAADFESSLGLRPVNTVQAVVGFGINTNESATVQTRSNEPRLIERIFVRQSHEATVVTEADRDYACRLATIDEMRDRALVTGDATLLQRADQMELELKSSTRAGFSFFGN